VEILPTRLLKSWLEMTPVLQHVRLLCEDQGYTGCNRLVQHRLIDHHATIGHFNNGVKSHDLVHHVMTQRTEQ
jgi:hypothetical protein